MLNLKTGTFLGVNKRSYNAKGVIVSETEYHRKVFEGWHSHANYHVTLILRGGNLEHRKDQEVEAAPGTIMFYRPGEFHRNTNTLHPSKNINVEIEDTFWAQYQTRIPATSHPLRADANSTMLKIYKECQIDIQSTASVHALVLALLSSPREETVSRQIPPWINLLREIINDRWNETLSLTELSELVRVHPVTISKSFPKHLSCTLGEYTRKVKIERAILLIAQSRNSLADVAYQCGFADQSHFIRAFKAITGFLPGEFKKF